MTPAEFTALLHDKVPLTAAIGARVVVLGDGAIEVEAPLAANRNHYGTAFGGSLALLGIISGWGLLQGALMAAGVHAQLVIQRSETDYASPVTTDLRARSTLPAEWPAFLDALRSRGKARIAVTSEIDGGGKVAVRHVNTYVAIAAREGGAGAGIATRQGSTA